LIDNWRWAGVPFYLAHRQRLAKRSTEIMIQFKRRAPCRLSADKEVSPTASSEYFSPEKEFRLLRRKTPGYGDEALAMSL